MSLYITAPCPTCGHPMKAVNGRQLKDWRETAGLTQRRFCGQLFADTGIHVTSPYISDIERNRRACPPAILAVYQTLKPKRKLTKWNHGAARKPKQEPTR